MFGQLVVVVVIVIVVRGGGGYILYTIYVGAWGCNGAEAMDASARVDNF
jgi:hypothetical protein